MKKILISLLSLMVILSGCGSDEKATQENTESVQETDEIEDTNKADESLSYGETFEFDGFELTISDQIEWAVVENQYSELNGQDVALIPVHIKNNSGETGNINMFYINLYGSKGTQLDGVEVYFDNVLGYNGNLRDGAEADTYLAVLYDGDGDYYVEFSSFTEKVEIKLPIIK